MKAFIFPFLGGLVIFAISQALGLEIFSWQWWVFISGMPVWRLLSELSHD
jgi:hypothetical protein